MVIIFAFINFYYMEFSAGLLQNPPPWGTPSSVLNHTYTSAKSLNTKHIGHGDL